MVQCLGHNRPIFGRKIGKKTPRQLILEAGAKFISKIINTQTPPEIYNMLVFPRKFRKNVKIFTKSAPGQKSAEEAPSTVRWTFSTRCTTV